MTRSSRAIGADAPMIVAVVFLALAFLTGALVILKLVVRKQDIIQGGYVEKDHDDGPTPTDLP